MMSARPPSQLPPLGEGPEVFHVNKSEFDLNNRQGYEGRQTNYGHGYGQTGMSGRTGAVSNYGGGVQSPNPYSDGGPNNSFTRQVDLDP